MPFDYEKQTKIHYKSQNVAQEYHRSFAESGGLNGLRFRFIADRERAITKDLLDRIPHSKVVDLPAGTGKMAPVYNELGSAVHACDISEEMLEIAKTTYGKAGCQNVTFQCVDLEHACEVIREHSDALVCIRLMHRVPADVKQRMLEQIATLYAFAIVSFGVESRYQRIRRGARRALLGGEDVGTETRQSRHAIEGLLTELFQIRHARPVSRLFSAEWIYLLESKRIAAHRRQ